MCGMIAVAEAVSSYTSNVWDTVSVLLISHVREYDVPTVTDRYTLSSTLTETPTITFTSTPTDTSRPSWTVRLPATVTVFEIETPGPTPNVQGEKKQVPPVAVDGVK